MKILSLKLFGFLFVFSLLLIGCSTRKKTAAKVYQLSVHNPSPIERADELMVLTREMIEQKTGKLAGGEYINITTPNNEPLVIQFDDLNKDGFWDEAVFLYTFEPNETTQLSVTQTNSRLNKAVVRAHVRMRKKNADNTFGPLLDSATVPQSTLPTDFSTKKLPTYLTEGPAWENDKVAFRIYMDTRNTKDIYGKRTPKMMMDTVGVLPENSYHNLSDWGMDILAVGKSLGAGSLAVSVPGVNGKDTLVRLGGANVEQTTFEKVADGPVRAIFRMHYKNWTAVDGIPPINVTEEISIWGGKYFYESSVTVTNAPVGAKVVTGIVNLKTKNSHELTVEGAKALYSYGLQSENKDNLGLAVIVKNTYSPTFGKTPNAGSEIVNTYTATMPLSNEPVKFRFYAGWEISDLLFTKIESFKQFLNNEAIEYGKSVTTEFK